MIIIHLRLRHLPKIVFMVIEVMAKRIAIIIRVKPNMVIT